MHVGYAPLFQNPDNVLSDADVYVHELRLAERAEPLGFDSLWSVEHHFTDYTMCPDVLQFLSYMAGKTQRVKLGSMVVVVPWPDVVVVAPGRPGFVGRVISGSDQSGPPFPFPLPFWRDSAGACASCIDGWIHSPIGGSCSSSASGEG